MTSILTNSTAMTALQTLRTIGGRLSSVQNQIGTGLRVNDASDNTAYWSIATTMRSDSKALSAVQDVLGLGAARVDVAYAALNSTIEVLSEFRAKLIVAASGGFNQVKVQSELEQLKQHLVSSAATANLAGTNWLRTNATENLADLSSLPAYVTSSYNRSADGSVHVGQIEIEIADISLFNLGGGGALQTDIRSLGAIGGFRYSDLGSSAPNGSQYWDMTETLTLGDTDTISFEIILDRSVHSTGETHSVTISKSTIDAALHTSNGVINDVRQYVAVLTQAFSDAGLAGKVRVSETSYPVPRIWIMSLEGTGQLGSSVNIDNVDDSRGLNGSLAGPAIDAPGGYAAASFLFTSPFTVHRDAAFTFDFIVDRDEWKTVTVDRSLVDATLGTSDGRVTTPADLAAILNAATSGKGLSVSAAGGTVQFAVDPAIYKPMGARSIFFVSNIRDNLGPAPDFDILDVDITNPANDIANYTAGVDAMLQKVINGASLLGATRTRIDLQASMTRQLMDSIERGIGQLVDANMDYASVRLGALQVQQQLAIQSLQIANSASDSIMQLFRQ